MMYERLVSVSGVDVVAFVSLMEGEGRKGYVSRIVLKLLGAWC